jgi:hypothetical protein
MTGEKGHAEKAVVVIGSTATVFDTRVSRGGVQILVVIGSRSPGLPAYIRECCVRIRKT